jgi:Zn-dependent protease with chaperone function
VTRLVAIVGLPPLLAVVVISSVLGRSLVAVFIGAVLGVAVAAALIAWVWQSAPAVFDHHLELTTPDPTGHARLLNLVDNLGAVIGLAEPRVLIVADRTVNGAVIGHSATEATVVVTEGMAEHLERVELEGALAWLLTRARDPRLWPDTLAARIVGVAGARVGLDGPIARSLAPLAGSPEMIAAADLVAAGTTRFPPGLAGALVHVDQHGSAVAGAPVGTEWLWIADPHDATVAGHGPVTHPELEHRIEVLREL